MSLTVNPNRVRNVRVDGRVRSDDQVNDSYSYIFCYLFILVFFAATNIAFGLDFITGVTASIACIGNVGPGFGDVGSMSNYADFPANPQMYRNGRNADRPIGDIPYSVPVPFCQNSGKNNQK